MDSDTGRRRNCADRLRRRIMERRRLRGKDPGMGVFLQLLAALSWSINLLPEPTIATSPFPSISPPPGPIVVPEASERAPRYKASPSWALLAKDLNRPPSVRRDALIEIRSRLPASLSPFIDDIERREDWSALRVYMRSGARDADVVSSLMFDARRWEADRAAALAARAAELTGGGGGTGGASSGAKPGQDGGRGMHM